MYLETLIHVVNDGAFIAGWSFFLPHSITYVGEFGIQNTAEYIYLYSEYTYMHSVSDNPGQWASYSDFRMLMRVSMAPNS